MTIGVNPVCSCLGTESTLSGTRIWENSTGDWPKGNDRSILKCSPKCNACMQLVMQGKPAYCPKWRKEKRAAYQEMFR